MPGDSVQRLPPAASQGEGPAAPPALESKFAAAASAQPSPRAVRVRGAQEEAAQGRGTLLPPHPLAAAVSASHARDAATAPRQPRGEASSHTMQSPTGFSCQSLGEAQRFQLSAGTSQQLGCRPVRRAEQSRGCCGHSQHSLGTGRQQPPAARLWALRAGLWGLGGEQILAGLGGLPAPTTCTAVSAAARNLLS